MRLQVLSLILVLVSCCSYAKAALKNGITYSAMEDGIAEIDKFKCQGHFGKHGLLDDIGYSDSQLLEKGVTCRQADFTGKGSVAYWVYKCQEGQPSCKSKVIFMNKAGHVEKVVQIKMPMASPDVFYISDKNNFAFLMKFGCKLPDSDALVELNDSDSNPNKVYVLNKQKNAFVEYSHCTSL